MRPRVPWLPPAGHERQGTREAGQAWGPEGAARLLPAAGDFLTTWPKVAGERSSVRCQIVTGRNPLGLRLSVIHIVSFSP